MLAFLPALTLLLTLAEPAATPTSKKVALKGQIACSGCWDEADRKTTPYGTKADMKCAARCSKEGIPAALAVAVGDKTELYTLEEGTFKNGKNGWLPLMAKQVEIGGSTRADKKGTVLTVDTLRVVEPKK